MNQKIHDLETKRKQLEEEFHRRMREMEIEIGKLKMTSDTPAPKPIKWMPERDQDYFFRDSRGQKCSDFWRDGTTDHYRRDHIGIYPTAEDCDRWYRIDAVIREACGEAVEGEDLYAVFGCNENTAFNYQNIIGGYDSTIRYWTNDREAADKINAALTEDDRRWFLTGGRG